MASENYKLLYFDARGRAEILRFLFLYANVDYEDARINFEQWPDVKPKLPFGKVPVLYVNDQAIADSGSATRYLARKFGLAGKNELETAQADVILEALRDMFFNLAQFVMESDETKKAENRNVFYEEKVPPFLDNIEKILKANGGTYFVGKQFTYADFSIANGLDELIFFSPSPSVLEKREVLQSLMKRVYAIPSIKKWVETRPKTPF